MYVFCFCYISCHFQMIKLAMEMVSLCLQLHHDYVVSDTEDHVNKYREKRKEKKTTSTFGRRIVVHTQVQKLITLFIAPFFMVVIGPDTGQRGSQDGGRL